MRILIVLFFAAAAHAPAWSQSFDCGDADLPAEVAICENPELAELDEEMASLYFSLPSGVRSEITQSQARWLRQRNACGYNFRCIERAYLQRIEFLSEY